MPKAPDMSQQVKQANQTFDTATSNAAQTMNTAQSYNQNAQKNLSSMTGNNNAASSAIMNNANTNLSTYGSTFVPLQQQQAQQAQNYTSEQNQKAQIGMAEANVNANAEQQRRNAQAALASEGVDPASIHGAALDAQSRVQQAAQAAQAGTNAYQQNIATGAALTNQANQLGMQVGNAGTSGAATSAGVNTSTQGAIDQANSSGVNNLTAANTYLNTGVNAANSATQTQQAQFGDQMQAYQAQQAANNSTLSSIGSIAGAAMMFMEEGGVVPRSGIPMPAAYDHGGPVSHRGALRQSPIPGSTDTKPALLTPGEFVIPHDVAAWKGHEYWYKQMDKAREERNARHGIPPQMSSVHTARGV